MSKVFYGQSEKQSRGINNDCRELVLPEHDRLKQHLPFLKCPSRKKRSDIVLQIPIACWTWC